MNQKELIHLYYSLLDIEEELHSNAFPQDRILQITKNLKENIINKIDDAPLKWYPQKIKPDFFLSNYLF